MTVTVKPSRYDIIDLIDALHDAPTGYHSSQADPAYAYESSGSVLVYSETGWSLVDSFTEDADFAHEHRNEDDAIRFDALLSRLSLLEDYVAEQAEDSAGDVDAHDVAERLRHLFREYGLDAHADTVTVSGRGAWFRAVGW